MSKKHKLPYPTYFTYERLAENPADEDAKRELAQVEDQIDHAAAQLWGLSDSELDEIRHALEILK